MHDFLLGLRELFIAVFFESALALLWISLIAAAFSSPQDFIRKPITTQYQWLKRGVEWLITHRNQAIAFVSIFLILGYPLGVAMQRATDDFVELGSLWMPKSSKLMVKKRTNPEKFELPIPWDPIGRDDTIRQNTIKDFYYKLQSEVQAVQRTTAGEEITNEKVLDVLNIARKAHTRRAFANGGHESGTYMRELLALVRICQATVAHVGLLALGYLLCAVVICGALLPRCGNGRIPRLFIIVVAGTVLWFGPRAHDSDEYNYPVLALLLTVTVPIVVFSFKQDLTREQTREQTHPSALKQLVIGFSIALLVWYLATFSWSEHRENYFESAIVLGVEADQTGHSAGLIQPVVTGFETSASAVVGKQLLIADDELVGAVLQCPEPLLTPWNCGIAKVQRQRKKSRPYTKQPRLAAIQDIEGLASDRDKIVFLVGSHESKGGVRRSDREFLIRANWDDEENELDWLWSYEGLARDFQKAFHDIGAVFELTDRKILEEFNVEGLAYSPVTRETGILYVGLRAPLTPDGEAIILAYNIDLNSPRMDFTTLRVNLGGFEIRGLDWDPDQQRLLIVAVANTNEDAGLAQPGVLVAYSPKTSSYELLKRLHGYSGEPEAVSRTMSGRVLILFDGRSKIDRGGLYVK